MNNVVREIARIKRQASHLIEDLEGIEAILSKATEKEAPEKESEVILVHEMALIMNRSTATIRRWIRQGKIQKPIKKGGVFYWLRSDLPNILKSGSKD